MRRSRGPVRTPRKESTARVERSATAIGARRAEKRADDDADDEQRDTVAMPAPTSSASAASKPSDDNGDATSILDPDPPMYAPRSEPMRRPALLAPLADPDLIGGEDHADEVGPRRLGPDDKTPPRRGRAAMLVSAFREPAEGGAA